MQTIEARVKVGGDRKLTIDLPDTVLTGEYEVVVILNHRSAVADEGDDRADPIARRWEKWFEQVDQLPLLDNPEEGDFQQHLIEKYRKQGLEL
jgi:hypothetical protein